MVGGVGSVGGSEQMKVRKKKNKEGGQVGLGLVWLFARSNFKYTCYPSLI